MTAAIRTIGLAAGYGKVAVVHDLDITVEPGEVVALMGPNGVGKTTALLTMAGVIPALAGRIEVDGLPTTEPLHRRARRGMALITDDRTIFRQLSVAENLRLGDGDPDLAVRMFPALGPLLHRQAGLLSGGEQQMLGLGRALAREPRLLLADELSLGLAPQIVAELFVAVRRRADDGGAVLLVEQQIRQVLRVCDRGYVLNQGRVVMAGSATDLLARADEIERRYLAAAL